MKIFVDTAPLIYLCEGSVPFQSKVSNQLTNWIEQGASVVSSVLTLMELSVLPNKNSDHALLSLYERNIQQLFAEPLHSIHLSTAITAAQFRARYGFRSIDSLQLASACETDCSVFYTNDFNLKKINEIRVITV